MQAESKIISCYYQDKHVILNLTLTLHPRTFPTLMELPFTNQGYKEFFPFKQGDYLSKSIQFIFIKKAFHCRPFF